MAPRSVLIEKVVGGVRLHFTPNEANEPIDETLLQESVIA